MNHKHDLPEPPFCANACASPASRSGSRRPMGNRNFPSRMSSANSRTFDASGRANTRATVTVGITLRHAVGKHRGVAKVPPFFTLPNSFAAVSPPTVSATPSTIASSAIAESSSMATVSETPSVRASANCRARTPAITFTPSFLAACTAARPTLPSAPLTRSVCPG